MEFLLQLLAELFSSPAPEEFKTDIKPVQKEVIREPESIQTSEEEVAGFFGLMQFH